MVLDPAHRSFRYLALASLVVGLVPLAFAASLDDPQALSGAFFGWTVAMYLFATGGTLVAATSFAPGEPMRPGWLLLSASYVALVPARLLAGASGGGLYDAGVRHEVVVTILSVLSGALGVAGFLSLARAWSETGLDTSSRAARVALRLAALVVALALAGSDLLRRFPDAAAGDPLAIGDVITDLLDGALFVVAVPVLRASLALGGGLVVWPWGLLTISLLAWLGYDAAVVWGGSLELSPRLARSLEEVMRSSGAGFAFSAGIAQRWIMQTPPGSARPR
jgi:hypothetical protein